MDAPPKELFVILFAIAAGFTASGIVANLYRLIAKKPASLGERIGYYAVMVVAGPNVLLSNATTSLRKKNCSRGAYWLAAAVTAYWSFVLGLFMLNMTMAL
jgi:hypothetical protein